MKLIVKTGEWADLSILLPHLKYLEQRGYRVELVVGGDDPNADPLAMLLQLEDFEKEAEAASSRPGEEPPDKGPVIGWRPVGSKE